MQCCSISFTQQHQGHLRWIKSAYFNTYFMCNLIFTQWVCANTDNTPSTFNLAVWRPRVKRGTCPLAWVPLLWSWTPDQTQTHKHTHYSLDWIHLPRLGCPCRCRYRQSRGGEDFTGGYSKMSPFLFQQLWLFVPTRKRRGCSSNTHYQLEVRLI